MTARGLRIREAASLQKRRRTIRDRYARERRERLEHRGQLVLPLEAERRLDVAALAALHRDLVTASVARRRRGRP